MFEISILIALSVVLLAGFFIWNTCSRHSNRVREIEKQNQELQAVLASHIEALRRMRQLEDRLDVASFVAHDIQHLTHSLKTRIAEISESHSLSSQQIQTSVGLMQEQLDSLRRLNSQLLHGVRAPAEKVRTRTLVGLVELVELAVSIYEENKIEVLIESDVCLSGAPEHIVRSLQNLINNALAASSSFVRIAVSATTFDQASAHLLGILPPGEYAKIEVMDNGLGIGEESLFKVFDPLFSPGKPGGFGLGLAFVAKVVRENHGALDVVSSDAGTHFTLYFPGQARFGDSTDLMLFSDICEDKDLLLQKLGSEHTDVLLTRSKKELLERVHQSSRAVVILAYLRTNNGILEQYLLPLLGQREDIGVVVVFAEPEVAFNKGSSRRLQVVRDFTQAAKAINELTVHGKQSILGDIENA